VQERSSDKIAFDIANLIEHKSHSFNFPLICINHKVMNLALFIIIILLKFVELCQMEIAAAAQD